MKKLKCALVALLLISAGISLKAQNPLLTKISAAQEKISSFESGFIQTRKNTVSGMKTTAKGTMFFSKPSSMALEFEKMDEDHVVINGDIYFVRQAKVANTFDVSKNAPVKILRNTLMWCLDGHPEKVAAEVDAKITASETSSAYVVVLTANQKQVRGYSKIILNYRKSDGLLTKMIMEEFTGMTTEYALTAPKPNASVDASHFAIPKK